MNISFKKSFKKQYLKLNKKDQEKIDITIHIFMENPKDLLLKNHKLKGLLIGKNAISVSSNIRIIFIEYDNYFLVEFLAVGTHNQVY